MHNLLCFSLKCEGRLNRDGLRKCDKRVEKVKEIRKSLNCGSTRPCRTKMVIDGFDSYHHINPWLWLACFSLARTKSGCLITLISCCDQFTSSTQRQPKTKKKATSLLPIFPVQNIFRAVLQLFTVGLIRFSPQAFPFFKRDDKSASLSFLAELQRCVYCTFKSNAPSLKNPVRLIHIKGLFYGAHSIKIIVAIRLTRLIKAQAAVWKTRYIVLLQIQVKI